VPGPYDRLFGLELAHLAVDGCSTKAPCGGQVAGPSPVDRRKQGLKRSHAGPRVLATTDVTAVVAEVQGWTATSAKPSDR
jgi:hypothetical protein